MTRWFVVLAIALAVLVVTYGVLIVVARRLPPGLLREVVEFLPACVTTARRLRRHPDESRLLRRLVG